MEHVWKKRVNITKNRCEKDEYTIAGVKEADPFANKISNASPIAKAILGHKQGETVVVASPNGDYKVKVAEIK